MGHLLKQLMLSFFYGGRSPSSTSALFYISPCLLAVVVNSYTFTKGLCGLEQNDSEGSPERLEGGETIKVWFGPYFKVLPKRQSK